jgi:pyruvate/2-oxoglutarate dehydrogenase complex dihydrolipoamide acyltransferase (E2) component
VSDAQRPGRDNETEVIPALSTGEGIAQTRELPVIEDEVAEPTVVVPPAPAVVPPAPVVVPPDPPVAAPQVPEPPAAPAAPPVAPAAPPVAPAAPPMAPAAPPMAAPPRTPAAPSSRRRGLLLATAVVAVAAVVAAVVVLRDRGTTGAGSAASATTALPVTATSFDPSGGSGFRQDGTATWRTQTYASADFGNLKEGVGLLLDVGAPRSVRTVTVEVVGGAIALQLRAADERAASASGYAQVTASGSASGSTSLTVPAGTRHRYWLLWVTRLAAQDGGYRAVLRNPVVKGTAA